MQATSRLESSVLKTASENSSIVLEAFIRGSATYSFLRVDGLSLDHSIPVYQEYGIWSVRQYAVLAKLTTPDLGQDPHRDLLNVLDEMARICS